jgi:serine/threonine-protein kinase
MPPDQPFGVASELAAVLPEYDITGELGRGTWGVVLAGVHRATGRLVAIKQLPAAFATDSGVRARFAQRTVALTTLHHPHLGVVDQVVVDDHRCLLVVERLTGGGLWGRLDRDGCTPPSAAAVALAVLAGLEAAHERGVVHGAVKPGNLLQSDAGVLQVTDLGTAGVVGGDRTLATRQRTIVGTPQYLAPEQARGGGLSPATDVYAVGMVLYALLAGRLPFPDDTDPVTVLARRAFERPTPLREVAPQVAPNVCDVVMRALAIDPAARHHSAAAFALDLADACTATWGPGWLAAQPLPVLASDRVVAATERAALPPRPWGNPIAQPGAGVPSPSNPADHRVRPGPMAGTVSASLAELTPADLIPVDTLAREAPSPALPLATALIAAVAMMVLAVVGIGPFGARTRLSLQNGYVQVGDFLVYNSAGSSPVPVVPLDLSRHIPVSADPGARWDRFRVTVSSLGVSRSKLVVAPVDPSTGEADFVDPTMVDLSSARYLLGGRLDAKVELLDGTRRVRVVRFQARTAQSGLATAMGVAAMLLVLLDLAAGACFARSLVRRPSGWAAFLGLGVAGMALGVGLVALMAAADVQWATSATALACASAGLVTGLCLASAAERFGKRRGYSGR